MARKIFPGVAGQQGDITLAKQADIRFADADSSNYVAFQSPATVASNVTWTLPSADGTSSQALTTNGSGTLSWADAGSALSDNNSDTNPNYMVFTTQSSGTFTSARVSTSNITYTPDPGTLTVNNLTVNGTTQLNEINEVLTSIGSYGTSQSRAYTTGNVFYISGLTGNYTFNWTGVPTTTGRTFALTHIIAQGGTPYRPGTLQINGSSVTINWAGNTTPSGVANRNSIVSFYIYNTSGSFTCLAALGSY